MSQESLFTGETETPVEPAPLPEGSEGYLSQLVGEDKKFKTAEELARGKAESDAFIARLQAENEGIREELKTRVTLQEFMDNMAQAKNNPQAPAEGTPAAEQNTAPVDSQKSGISPEDLESLLEKKLREREQQTASQRNLQQVTAKLQETFGPSYVSEVKKKAAELGVGEQFFDSLAKTQPNAFLKLMDVTGTTAPRGTMDSSPPNSQVNTSAQSYQGTTKKNMAYFDKIKESDPNTYWSAAMQNEIHREALKQGEEFFTTS